MANNCHFVWFMLSKCLPLHYKLKQLINSKQNYGKEKDYNKRVRDNAG